MATDKGSNHARHSTSSRPQRRGVAYRNSATGSFVTPGYAKMHPKTTSTERHTRNTDRVIDEGIDTVIKSTQKQISAIDQMAVKYGL